jgi:hypothetical protein
VTFTELRTDVVILACAVSAGIHAALVPDHLREGVAAGTGFAAAAVVLALLALVLTREPSELALVAAVLVFAGLIVSYAFVLTMGIPVLHPDVEPADGLAVVTKAVEVIGLAAAAALIRRPSLLALPQPKGTLT